MFLFEHVYVTFSQINIHRILRDFVPSKSAAQELPDSRSLPLYLSISVSSHFLSLSLSVFPPPHSLSNTHTFLKSRTNGIYRSASLSTAIHKHTHTHQRLTHYSTAMHNLGGAGIDTDTGFFCGSLAVLELTL